MLSKIGKTEDEPVTTFFGEVDSQCRGGVPRSQCFGEGVRPCSKLRRKMLRKELRLEFSLVVQALAGKLERMCRISTSCGNLRIYGSKPKLCRLC